MKTPDPDDDLLKDGGLNFGIIFVSKQTVLLAPIIPCWRCEVFEFRSSAVLVQTNPWITAMTFQYLEHIVFMQAGHETIGGT